jgi:hypothetical protein
MASVNAKTDPTAGASQSAGCINKPFKISKLINYPICDFSASADYATTVYAIAPIWCVLFAMNRDEPEAGKAGRISGYKYF